MKNFYYLFSTLVSIAFLFYSCQPELSIKNYEQLVDEFESWYVPLYQDIKHAEYRAAVTGNELDYQLAADLNVKLNNKLSNSKTFKRLEAYRQSNIIENPQQKRELELIYNEFLMHQIDPQKMEEMVRLNLKVNQLFSTFHPKIDNLPVSHNSIDEVLSTSLNSAELEQAWMAGKQVGEVVAKDFIRLVKLRNEAARSLGFENYFDLRIRLSGHKPELLASIYDEFDLITKDLYHDLKEKIDEQLSIIYSVPEDNLMPWHYQNLFFQDAPNIYRINFDEYYEGKDIVKLAENFFLGMGIDLSDIYAKSHVVNNHQPTRLATALTMNMDRSGDVRILASISESESGMNTLLYESGIAAYEKYIDQQLAFMLREPSQIMVADAIATFFGRFSANPDWIKEVTGVEFENEPLIRDHLQKHQMMSKLIFARWAQVMYHFEKDLYENPERDLNQHWWNLVEKYQHIEPPAGRNSPDWISKAHFITQPCMYHNYMLGELFACQLYHHINTQIIHDESNCVLSCVNEPAVGDYLVNQIFRYGKIYHWDELVNKSTGESLNVDYYRRQFVNAGF